MNKWIVVQTKEKDKFYAYIIKVSESDNLLSVLNVNGIVSANFYSTKKKAESVTRELTKHFKLNGNYMFDETF